MLALLNPRFLILLAVAAALAFSHFTVYRKGKQEVRNEWQVSVAAANEEARRLERARQSRADEAGRMAASREAGIRADATRAGDALQRMRNDLAARPSCKEPGAPATKAGDSDRELLIESLAAHRELAQACDGHVNDLRMLLEAWPK